MKFWLEAILLVMGLEIYVLGQSQATAHAAQSHYQQALEYFLHKNPEKARQEATLAIKLSPEMVEAENLLGVIARDLGELAVAETHFNRALKIRPNFTQGHFNLAKTYLKLN